MKKNKLLTILLTSIISLSVTACSATNSTTATSPNEVTQLETPETLESETVSTTETPEAVIGINPKWAETSVFYEVFVRSFADSNGDGIGDFKGIEENLSYLKDLGINGIWLMPMMESTTYHGYDVVDYYSPNPDYGTIEEFDSLVNACHENDIKLIIDFVVNHTSSSNEWFTDALSDSNSKYRDFYSISETIPVKESDASYSEWKKDDNTGLYYYAHYDSIMPDLNYSNQEVRDEIKNVADIYYYDLTNYETDDYFIIEDNANREYYFLDCGSMKKIENVKRFEELITINGVNVPLHFDIIEFNNISFFFFITIIFNRSDLKVVCFSLCLFTIFACQDNAFVCRDNTTFNFTH